MPRGYPWIVLLATVAVWFVACTSDPFQRLDPAGTTWRVVTVDGVASDLPIVLEFDRSRGFELSTPCRTILGDRWIDTRADRWAVVDTDTISLIGASQVALDRVP